MIAAPRCAHPLVAIVRPAVELGETELAAEEPSVYTIGVELVFESRLIFC